MPAYNLALISEPTQLLFLDPSYANYGAGYAARFDDAKAAIDYAKAEGLTGYRPAIYVDSSWKYREQARMSTIYQSLVWREYFSPICDHYAHVSLDDLTKIAFTESPEKGMQDRQTRMTPGKYLAKFYPHLTQEQILSWSEKHTEGFTTLKAEWASTPDEIEAVYSLDASFSSCVQHPADHFKSSVHPCRIYGAGDLKLAYIKSADGRLKARALVWPEKQLVGRIYGDTSLLRGALAIGGLVTSSGQDNYDDLSGARVLKIMEDGYLVAPYIDGTGHVRDMGDHLVLSSDSGDIACNTPTCEQTGFQSAYDEEHEDDRSCCANCDDRMDDDDIVPVEGRYGEDLWCSHCAEREAFYCDNTDRTYADNRFTAVEVHSPNQTWTTTFCLERSLDDVIETESGEYWRIDDTVTVTVDGDEQTWSCAEFEADGFQCVNDSECYPVSESVEVDGDLWHRDNAEANAYALPDGTYSETDPDQLTLDLIAA